MPWPSFLHIIDIMSFAKNAMLLFCSFFLLYYNAAVLAKGEHREPKTRIEQTAQLMHTFFPRTKLIAAFSQMQSIFSRNISVSVLVAETPGEPVLRKFLIADISASVFL